MPNALRKPPLETRFCSESKLPTTSRSRNTTSSREPFHRSREVGADVPRNQHNLLCIVPPLRMAASPCTPAISRRKVDVDQHHVLGAVSHAARRVPQRESLSHVQAHLVANNLAFFQFAGLFIVRFGLGICEGSITAGFMIVTSMFYTRTEQGQRVGMWVSCSSFRH